MGVGGGGDCYAALMRPKKVKRVCSCKLVDWNVGPVVIRPSWLGEVVEFYLLAF